MFYYGLIMMVGNEMAPVDFSQYIFVSLTVLLGSLFMAWIFGSIAATISSINTNETKFADMVDYVQQAMVHIKIKE